jgi:germination protein M
MKKVYLVIIGFLILTGCTLPADSGYNESSNSLAQVSEPTVAGEQLIVDSNANTSTTEFDIDNRTLINLYYQDREGCLIPVTRRVEKQLALANLAIKGLIDSSINREELEYFGLYPVLPMGTEILGINIKDGNAVIDFNEKLLDYETDTAERSIVASIVYTLTEFKTIEKVKILIKGNTINQLKFNTDLSDYISRENVLINSDRVNLEPEFKKLDIFLFRSLNDKFSYIIPMSMKISDISEDKLPKKIIGYLAKEKITDGYYSEFPKDTILIKSEITGSVLKLNFSKELMNIGGTAREDGIIKQILYSSKQIKGIEKVMISVEGKSEYLPEGTDISKEIKIPQNMNDYIDKE